MNEIWGERVDSDWVQQNLIDIENCWSNPDYVWDALAFGGTLSFAQFFIAVHDNSEIVNPQLDLSFLNSDRLCEKLVYALNNMLEDLNSREQLGNSWEDLANDIKYCLSRLDNLKSQSTHTFLS